MPNKQKLPVPTVIDIKERIAANEPYSSIAKDHGILKSRVASIAVERLYAHVTVESFSLWRERPRPLRGEVKARQIMDLLCQGVNFRDAALTQDQIAERLQCAQSTVSEIHCGKRWRHLDHPWNHMREAMGSDMGA